MKAEADREDAMPLALQMAEGALRQGDGFSPRASQGSGLQFQLKTTQMHSLTVLESTRPNRVSGR